MDKRIVTVSYWLGLLSSLIALGMRALGILGILARNVFLVSSTAWYDTFYHGAILFFLIAIATAKYASVPGEKTS